MTAVRLELPENSLDAGCPGAPDPEVDDQPGDRQDRQRQAPKHAGDQSAVAERFAAVEAIEERLVRVRLDRFDLPGLGADDVLLVLSAGGFAGIYDDSRI